MARTMEILRSVLGAGETVSSQVSSAETIERLVDRVNTSTLLEDRRDACRGLKGRPTPKLMVPIYISVFFVKAMSKKFRLEVGAQGLSTLIEVLATDTSDSEIISYVLDTLCNVCSPGDTNTTIVYYRLTFAVLRRNVCRRF